MLVRKYACDCDSDDDLLKESVKIGRASANEQTLLLSAHHLKVLKNSTALLEEPIHQINTPLPCAKPHNNEQVKTQPKMLKAGLLEPVVAETRNALDPKSKNDHETIRYCLLVIANLSVSRENHGVIMSQCLETLTSFSKHRDVKARHHAVFALGNICANPENIEAIVAGGALKTLITYAFPSTDISMNAQFQAIAALRGISTHQTLRIQVVREGGLEALVLAAKSDSMEIQRETAATLANLSLAEENKVSVGLSRMLCLEG